MPPHQTAITDLAQQSLTLLKALSTPTSPSYSCSLSRLPPTQRIPLAFALADRSFPFALTPKDLATAYTVYEPMAKLALNPPPPNNKTHPESFCAHCNTSLRGSVVSYSEPSGKPGYICTPCMDKYAKAQESLHGRGAPPTPKGLASPTLIEPKPLTP